MFQLDGIRLFTCCLELRGLGYRSTCYYVIINSDSSFQKYRLTSDEWAFLEHVLNILQPIYDVTNFLSNSKYPSISLVIPAYSGCLEQIQSVAVLNNDLMDLQLAIEKKNQ